MTEFRLDEDQLHVLDRLARSMVLNRGFAVHLLVSDMPELLGPAVLLSVARSLEADGSLLRLQRFDHENLEQLIDALDDADRERRLLIVDLSELPLDDDARACDLFTSLNGRRDTLLGNLRGELVVCVPARLEQPMLAAGPDLATTVRVWLLPRPQLDREPLGHWLAHCDARFDALLATTDGARERYRHGTYTFAYCFEAEVRLSLPELRQRLAAIPGHTGWRPWWVPDNTHVPAPHEGELECWMFGGEQTFPDPAHSDYWRASPRGCLYLRRGYDEDSTEARGPGRVFSNSLAIWRTAEALLQVEGFARELGLSGHRRVTFAARWVGLSARRLSTWPERSASELDDAATRPAVSTTIGFELAELSDGLETLVDQLVGPLYECFSGAAGRPDLAFVSAHVQRLLERKR